MYKQKIHTLNTREVDEPWCSFPAGLFQVLVKERSAGQCSHASDFVSPLAVKLMREFQSLKVSNDSKVFGNKVRLGLVWVFSF